MAEKRGGKKAGAKKGRKPARKPAKRPRKTATRKADKEPSEEIEGKEIEMNENTESMSGFDEPPSGDDEAAATEEELEEEVESEWEEPDDAAESEAAASDVSGTEQAAEFGEDLLAAHAAVEQQLEQQAQAAGATGRALSEDAYSGSGNIVGVGLGSAEQDVESMLEPGAPALNLYVAEPCSVDEAKAALVDGMGVQAASSDDLAVNVIVTGPIDALPHRFRIRPAPGGVSCGHVRITAGTLGCLSRGRRPPRNRRLMILSNNHVLANSNNARFGDSIIQPGRADGGRSPRDRIAILERFVRIRFGGPPNWVDCATGWAWPRRVRRELIFLRRGRRRLFRISSRIVRCRPGMLVGKSGRTTQLRVGRITDCSATIRVNYGGGRIALFRDQIAVRDLRRDFSRGGDSGSVVWTWNRSRNPVGLLFAGGGNFTFANKIARVLNALDIALVT